MYQIRYKKELFDLLSGNTTLEKLYADISNKLKMKAYEDMAREEYQDTKEFCKNLEEMIISQYMSEHNFFLHKKGNSEIWRVRAPPLTGFKDAI